VLVVLGLWLSCRCVFVGCVGGWLWLGFYGRWFLCVVCWVLGGGVIVRFCFGLMLWVGGLFWGCGFVGVGWGAGGVFGVFGVVGLVGMWLGFFVGGVGSGWVWFGCGCFFLGCCVMVFLVGELGGF